MKKTLFFFALFLSAMTFAQKQEHVETLTYAETQDRKTVKGFSNNMSVDNFIAADGKTYSVGSTIVLLEPSNTSDLLFNKFDHVIAFKFDRLLWDPKYEVNLIGANRGDKYVIQAINYSKPLVMGDKFLYFTILPEGKNDPDEICTVRDVNEAIKKGEITLVE